MDPALEETARALGESPWGAFRRVVLPQLRPALLGGMLLVALNTLVEFGAFALLRYRTFTTEIYAEYRIGFGGPQASLLAMILILLCAICLVAEQKVRGRRRYARTSRGTRGAPVVYDLGWKRWPAGLAFTAFGGRDPRHALRHDRLLAHPARLGRHGAGLGISAPDHRRDRAPPSPWWAGGAARGAHPSSRFAARLPDGSL